MRIMQLLGWQTLYNRKSLCVSPEAREGNRIGYCAIDLLRSAIVRFLRKLMRSFRVLPKIDAEPGQVRCDRRLGGRGLMKTLEYVVKLRCFVVRPIEPAQSFK